MEAAKRESDKPRAIELEAVSHEVAAPQAEGLMVAAEPAMENVIGAERDRSKARDEDNDDDSSRSPLVQHSLFMIWLKVVFLKKIEVRQNWGEGQEADRTSSFELFFDLLYVAVALQLGEFLKKHLDSEGFLVTLMLMALFLISWLDVVVFMTRFKGDSATVSALMFLAASGVLGMSLIDAEKGFSTQRNDAFLIGFIVTRAAMSCSYALAWYTNRKYRLFTRIIFIHFSVELLLSTIALVAMESVLVPLFVVCIVYHYLANMFVNFCVPREGTIPINIHHFSERFGELINIFLGESIIGLVIPDRIDDSRYYITVFCGFVSIFSMKHIYFSVSPHNPDEHALRISKGRGRAFTFLNQFLCIALLGVGTSLKLFVTHSIDSKVKDIEALLFSTSFALAVFFANAIRWLHKQHHRLHLLFLRLCIVIAIALQPVYKGSLSPHEYIALVATYLFLLAIIDLFEFDSKKHRHAFSDTSSTGSSLSDDKPIRVSNVKEGICKYMRQHSGNPKAKPCRLFNRDMCQVEV